MAYSRKTNCPKCNSSDGNAVYADGHAFCYACNAFTPAGGVVPTTESKSTRDYSRMRHGEFKGFRGIDQETCKKYGYMIDHTDTHIAPYYTTDGQFNGQHYRSGSDKSSMPFALIDSDKAPMLFGQQLFKKGGKKLVICEGEIDALSVASAMGSYPVVGLPGVNRADKMVKENLEFINSFEEVIIFMDNDEPGRLATKTILEILPFGKTKFIKEFPQGCKDANDILQKFGLDSLRQTVFFKAEEYKPDTVTYMKDIVFKEEDFSVSLFPWSKFNHNLLARRSGEITIYTAGSGIGKSTILRAIYSDLMKQGEKCAAIMLEETIEETKAELMSSLLGYPLRKLMAKRAINRSLESKGQAPIFNDLPEFDLEAIAKAETSINDSGMILIDHSKGYTLATIVSTIQYLARAKGVKHILLDHISILISSDASVDNEVKAMDVTMKELRVLAEELSINIDIISHIRKRPTGSRSVNSGASITIEELRGSGSLFQIANSIIAFERSQQNEDDKNYTVCRSLKARLSGYTGILCGLRFDPETGTLTEEEHIETDGKDTGFSKTQGYNQQSSDY